jgi:hypothetical protein
VCAQCPVEHSLAMRSVWWYIVCACVYSVWWNTVRPCAVSGGTSFVCVCMQCLVCTSLVCVVSGGTSLVCVYMHSVWWYIACVCSVLWYKFCVCACMCSIWWYTVCVQSVWCYNVHVRACVVRGGGAVSGGTQYVCGVQGLVADPV